MQLNEARNYDRYSKLSYFIKFIFKQLFKSKLFLIIIVLFTFYDALFNLACSFYYGFIFDKVIPENNIKLLIIFSIVLIIALSLLCVFNPIKSWLTSKLGIQIINNLRLKLLNNINNSLLNENFFKSDFIKALNADMAILEYYLCNQVFKILYCILLIVPGLFILCYLNWVLTIILITLIIILFFISAKISHLIEPVRQQKKEIESKVNLIANESIDLNKVNYTLNLKDRMNKSNDGMIKAIDNPARKFHFYTDSSASIPGLCMLFLTITTFQGGVILSLMHYLTLGELITFVTLFAIISNQLGTTFKLLPLIRQAHSALIHILPYYYMKQDLIENNNKNRDSFKDIITIKNLHFSYDKHTKGISNVSFSIKKGQWVAVIGTSGSGKSTLLKLILGLIKPQKGQILFDGVDINTININSHFLDSRVVFQEPKLYSMSIENNIKLANPDATKDEVIKACQKAQIHDDIMQTKNQYKTIVGSEGDSELSGGQTQRITIARALISEPEIIYLDEATSALDPKSTKKIIELIEKTRGRQTYIHICHDINLIKTCDQIIVLDKGEVVEIGDHDSLMKNYAKYYELYNLQQSIRIDKETQTTKINESILRKIPLFNGLEPCYLDKLSELFDIQHVGAGEIIIKENTVGKHFYIIASGVVNVSKSINGKLQHTTTLDVGDFFGEISLLYSSLTSATITAKHYTVLIYLSQSRFHNFFNSLPKDQQNMIYLTAKQRA